MERWHGARWLVVLLLLALVAGEALKIHIPELAANCSTHRTCLECTGQPDCGWCDSDSPHCASGSINGPGDTTECNTGLWKYSNCREDDLCSIQQDCQSCGAQSGCGWCDTRCVAGNSEGPKNTEVPCDYYAYRATSCQSYDCVEFTTCDVCTQQTGCSWCQETVFGKQTCLAGDANNINGDCPAQYWQTNNSQCANATPCSSYQNCSTCLADPNEQCGWCNGNSKCLPRDNPEYCTEFNVNSCNEQCTNFRDCLTCTSVDVCGWCHSGFQSVCTYGTATGPSILNGSRCDWYYDTCPQCDYPDCATCERDAGCVWCSVPLSTRNVSECFPLNTQPSNATCSGCNITSSTPTASPSVSASASASTSASVSASLPPSPSRFIQFSRSSSHSATESASVSASSSNSSSVSLSSSASMSASVSASASPSYSKSSSTSGSSSSSQSAQPSASSSPSMSHSSSASASTSFLPSSSSSVSGSVPMSPSNTPSITATPSPPVSQTATRSPQSPSAPLMSPTSSTSPSPSLSLMGNPVPPPQESNSVPWGMIGLGIAILCIMLVVLLGIGSWIFYRFYWLKRWYFVRLE